MAEEKKEENLEEVLDKGGDEIAKYFANVSKEEDFDKRLKAFKEFHDPHKQIPERFLTHSRYVILGHPSRQDEFPGVYNVAHKVLDEKAEKDSDTLTEEQVTEVMEAYVDKFLEHATGVDEPLKEMMEAAKKRGLSDEDLRELKGSMFARYHTEQDGNYLNPLDKGIIKDLTGKTKLDLKTYLSVAADNSLKKYNNLLSKAARNLLVKEKDFTKLVEVMDEEFKDLYEHDTDLILKEHHELVRDYSTHLQRKDMSQWEYRPAKKQENPE